MLGKWKHRWRDRRPGRTQWVKCKMRHCMRPLIGRMAVQCRCHRQSCRGEGRRGRKGEKCWWTRSCDRFGCTLVRHDWSRRNTAVTLDLTASSFSLGSFVRVSVSRQVHLRLLFCLLLFFLFFQELVQLVENVVSIVQLLQLDLSVRLHLDGGSVSGLRQANEAKKRV